ncbi:hypothetical protein GIB67_037367 [Kingdonia uniflora]|uniref:Aminotransferase-like plant mobile domain-containing protein n=1 Tax=Kingdonia uniflora TaxID=39325 RepID=A0A7J7M8F0_9MAGN|nr:hypothetical protein GIB67_037367 [Kingdonia uniflora]
MYLPDSIYPYLKAGGQRISLSLKKIAGFFAGKVGTNSHDSASASFIRLSSRMDQHVSKPWSWGAATLAHLYYSLGVSSRVNAKGLACCTTLLEIFEHFPKLPGIPTGNESGAPEFCTRWCWSKTTSAQTSSVALTIFREALDSYKVEDVIFDPYVVKMEDKHMFEEVASFTGLLCSPEHKGPYYPDRVQRQFNRRQPVPRAPTFVEKSGLHFGDKAGPYNLKYDWEDLFSEEKWRDSITLMRGRKVHNGIPDEVPHNQNEGSGGPDEDSFGTGIGSEGNWKNASRHSKNLANSICEKKLNEKTLECETNKKLLKDLTLECESTKKILEDQRLECESNKKLVEDLHMQLAAKLNKTETLGKINDKLMDEVYVHQIEVPLPLNIVPHLEENVGEAEMWKQKYEELHAKFEEAQRRLSEIDKNGVWRLTLKGAIEGGNFKDPEDLTYEELGRQFTKLLTIAQEGPNGEYEDDIILSGRGEYQEMIDSRLKTIDHKTNLRQSLFNYLIGSNWIYAMLKEMVTQRLGLLRHMRIKTK